MEELLCKIIIDFESQESCFIEIKADILGLGQKVELDDTVIMQIKKQFWMM